MSEKSIKSVKSIKRNSRGFVLLFSILLASIVLSMSLGAFNIALKDLLLSATGRESQFAFYAADAGAECAVYWDVRHFGMGAGIFPNPPPNATDPAPTWDASKEADCSGKNIVPDWVTAYD